MLDLLLIIAFAWLMISGVQWLFTKQLPDGRPLSMKGIEPCPPHKWEYKKFKNVDGSEYERMVCTKCTTFPGVY